MLWPQDFLAARQNLPIKGLSPIGVASSIIVRGEVGKLFQRVGMVRSRCGLAAFQSPLEDLLGVVVAPLSIIEEAERIHEHICVWVLRAQFLLRESQHLFGLLRGLRDHFLNLGQQWQADAAGFRLLPVLPRSRKSRDGRRCRLWW